MEITRCRDQKSKTLDEFYGELSLSTEPSERQIGETMVSLLARLRALSDLRRVWGLTSHYRLCLLAADSYETPGYVTVLGTSPGSYFIEYLMPEPESPWPNARVAGEARSEDEAVRMILIGMEQSGGWSQSADQ